jgi:hypothetical protein
MIIIKIDTDVVPLTIVSQMAVRLSALRAVVR